MKTRNVLGLLSLLPCLALLAGCETKLDDAKLKEGVTKMFKEQLSLEVTGLTCPKDVKVKAGEKMDCDVAVKGGSVPIVVTMTDDSGNVDMKTKVDVLRNEKLTAAIAEKLGSKVDCGTEVRLVKPDTKFQCTSADGKKIDVEIDAKNDVSWKVQGGDAPAAEAPATP